MKRKRFSVEQIVGILKQAEVGVPVTEVIRKAGISEADLLSMEEAVRGAGSGSGAPAQATPGGEHAAEAVGC
jgi:Transposase